MKLRTLAPLALLLASAAHGALTLSFGTLSGTPLIALAAPAVGSSTTISVFYTSDVALSDGELLAAFDRSMAQGTGATRLDSLLSLSTPAGAPGVALSGVGLVGGGNSAATPAGTARPYGLSVLGVSGPGNALPATATPARLMDLTLTNLALAPGSSYTLSFLVSDAPLFTTQFFDANVDVAQISASALRVTAAPVPEPAPPRGAGLRRARPPAPPKVAVVPPSRRHLRA